MSFPRKKFIEGYTYHEEDWDTLQNNIGNYYDNLINLINATIEGITTDYLTSAHITDIAPHPNQTLDNIKDSATYKRATITQLTNLNTIWSAFGGSPSMDNIPQGSTHKKITTTEKGYYDIVYSAFGGSPSMDNIPQGSTHKKITTAEKGYYDLMYSAFGGSPSMDNIPQGSTHKKLTAAEYAKFLTGFYDILDQTTTVKFGHNRDINGFYFAKGGDADGANIYANNLYSRGKPAYVLAYASSWYNIAAGLEEENIAHNLGYRPEFAILQVCNSDPTGQPEDYISTEGYAQLDPVATKSSHATWNNTDFNIYNRSNLSYHFRVLLFSYPQA